MTDRLIRIKTVIDMTGMSRSAIYAAIAKGCFPNSIQLSARSVAWAESDIVAWVRGKIDAPKSSAKVSQAASSYITAIALEASEI
jgi:prophage regulatory protein